MAKARRFRDGNWDDAILNDFNESLADMDEAVFGKNCGVIGADGGPCPLIGILNRGQHAAAIIHILGGLVEMQDHSYVGTLEVLRDQNPDFFDGAEAIVCMDKTIPFVDPEGNSGPIGRTRYYRKVVRNLKKMIPNTRQTMRSDGKYIRIDTTNLTIRVIDDVDSVLFEA